MKKQIEEILLTLMVFAAMIAPFPLQFGLSWQSGSASDVNSLAAITSTCGPVKCEWVQGTDALFTTKDGKHRRLVDVGRFPPTVGKLYTVKHIVMNPKVGGGAVLPSRSKLSSNLKQRQS